MENNILVCIVCKQIDEKTQISKCSNCSIAYCKNCMIIHGNGQCMECGDCNATYYYETNDMLCTACMWKNITT